MSSYPAIKDCQLSADIPEIQHILNEVIKSSTALYDYEPRSLEQVRAWATQKISAGLPLRGAFNTDGQLIGFATFGPFRPQPAYKYTVEHSVYVKSGHHGQGIATALMSDLLKRAEIDQYHVVVGCIDADNRASIALHEKLGFEHCGTVKQAGFKFGRWLNAAFYQKTLLTPVKPVDG
ncbi:MAG: N-acetyltransferase family protein [Burkholderiaceae bacterium]|nr:N-acetyltransferase family protein [Burkholderiaceae bacterium]MCD8517179.1 N-acetyltransferase family protein [Burkholderiaceae bacterium]MCD8536445.1 N-acetyltransferase family protein [Burkholderiaceae bacterium]MCD8565275.1 N-acetyltransferase family protein [Burkholderiaceae bacterium]